MMRCALLTHRTPCMDVCEFGRNITDSSLAFAHAASLPVQVLAEHCGLAARTASGEWPAMAPAAWRVCMRQAFTMAAPATVAAELAVAGAEARQSVRLFLVDNDTSQARHRPCGLSCKQGQSAGQLDMLT